MNIQKIKIIKSINDEIQCLVQNTGVDWELKYALIFSENGSQRVISALQDINIHFDWYDPDTSYEEDVRSFSSELDRVVRQLGTIS